MQTIEQKIRARKSVRDYVPAPLSEEQEAQIISILTQEIKLPFEGKPRFELVRKAEYANDTKIKLGTYGCIRDAAYFVVGAIAPSPHNDLVYGYALEKIILDLTALQLATCWLGGTLRRTDFGRAIKLTDNEVIPAITPVGINSGNQRFLVRMQQRQMASHKRKPWAKMFFLHSPDTALEPQSANAYQLPLEMLRLSPSAENIQPWRVIYNGEHTFHFYLKRTPLIKAAIKTADLQKVDIGIAMCHFELSLNENGIYGTWTEHTTLEPLKGLEYVASWQKQE